MIYRVIVYVVLSVGAYLAAERSSVSYSYEDYNNYLTLLTGVSGMVFTIMGIWIAFLYPNAMSRIVSPDKLVAKDFSESKSDARRLESIVGAVMIAALVLVSALLITLAKILLLMTPFYLEYRLQLKAAGLSTLIFLTLVQLESVFFVVLSNVMFINDLHFKRQVRQADEEL
ncbi:MAG: hypothetical protein Q7U84_03835 [Polynucleobacter sp.]|nr:hypothetical protein [Polynucleobacter sp.]